MKKVNIIILVFLPILFIIIAFSLKNEIPHYFLSCIDPEFCYLFNGLNLANFHMPWHIDHPGSTLQILSTIVIWIVHLFNNNSNITDDVFRNPDLYLNAINATIISVNAIAIFITGYLIYTNSKSILLGLFFQLTPFVSCCLLSITNRVIVEQFFIFIVLSLVLAVYLYLNDLNRSKRIIDKYVLIFAIITGFGIATKILFAPLFLIPFILLKGFKKKAFYSLFVLIAFFIFAFPVLNRMNYFTQWISDLFIHSGQYGQGKSSIIDFNSFKENLKFIFTNETMFPKVIILSITTCLVYYLPFLKLKVKNDFFHKALVGVSTTMILLTLIVAKQLKYFYLTPVLLLMILALYLIISIYIRPLKFLNKKIIILPLFAAFLFIIYSFEVKQAFQYHSENLSRAKALSETYNKVQSTFINKPVLIIPNYYGAPYLEYSLFFGINWSGEKMKNRYAQTLVKLYPNSYFYHNWNNLFNYWHDSYSFIDLLKKYHNLILFSGDPEVEKSLFSKLHGINRQLDTKFNKTFVNENTKEAIYEVSFDSMLETHPHRFFFDAEQLDSSKQNFINSEGLIAENGNTQSSDYARSGKFSCKLTKENPYGLTCVISEVTKGEHYVISVWRNNNGNNIAGLVVSANDAKKYYSFQSQSNFNENNWQKIEIDFIVPESAMNEDIKFYVWNRDSNQPAYFDDLTIERIP
jgi:hypothetical protein